MTRSLVSLSLALVATILLLGSPALACKCMVPAVESARDDATALFEGRVLSIEQTDVSPATNGELRVTLAVVRTWKGLAKEEQVVVFTNGSGAACGFTFAEKSSYLIYARASDDQKLHVSGCSRSKSIANASEDLAFLGAGSTPVAIEKTIATGLDGGAQIALGSYVDAGDGNLPPVTPATATPTAAVARKKGCSIGQTSENDASLSLWLGLPALALILRRRTGLRSTPARRTRAERGRNG